MFFAFLVFLVGFLILVSYLDLFNKDYWTSLIVRDKIDEDFGARLSLLAIAKKDEAMHKLYKKGVREFTKILEYNASQGKSHAAYYVGPLPVFTTGEEEAMYEEIARKLRCWAKANGFVVCPMDAKRLITVKLIP